MAANFWESTQRRNWLFSKDQLATIRRNLEDEEPGLVSMYPLPSIQHLNIYFIQQINRLGLRLSVRQQALATAQTYLKRFYTRVEIRRTNPFVVVATAVYLACKMEECPQHIRMVTSEARALWPSEVPNLDTSKMGEYEFFIISEMHSNLIVHQPYRTLSHLQNDLALSRDDFILAWSLINDHYMTDLPLLYPPHIIAFTACFIVMVLTRSPTTGGQQQQPQQSQSQSQSQQSQPQQSQSQSQSKSSLQQQVRAAATGLANMAATCSQPQNQGQVKAPSGLLHTPALTPQSSGTTTPQLQHKGEQVATGTNEKKAPDQRSMINLQRFAYWLADSNIDVEAMIDCTQELIVFFEFHEHYSDRAVRDQISRYVRARGLDK